MTPKRRMALLALLALLQIGAGAWTVARHEAARASGTEVRLRFVPGDSYAEHFGPLRVRYGFPPQVPGTDTALAEGARGRGCVLFTVDAGGYALPTEFRDEAPAEGLWLAARALRSRGSQDVTPSYPVETIYLSDAARKRFEERRNLTPAGDSYVLVRVRDGVAAVLAVVVHGERLAD